MRRITTSPASDDRLASVEARLLALLCRLDAIPDIREQAATATAPDVQALTASYNRLQALIPLLHEEAGHGHGESTDLLVARVVIQTLAEVAIELRRSISCGSVTLGHAREHMRAAKRTLAEAEHALRHLEKPADDH